MTKSSVEEILRQLDHHRVRYLIVGGLAVVAHGYLRFTASLDLVLDFDEVNMREAVSALRNLHYRPRESVSLDDFIDPAKRDEWVGQKQMTLLPVFSAIHPETEIGLFLHPPFDFNRAYSNASRYQLTPDLAMAVCGLPDLLALKQNSNRPMDAIDIAKLREMDQRTQVSNSSDRPTEHTSSDEWPVGWDGHERAQLYRVAQLPFVQKLQWLEEAHQLVTSFTQARPTAARVGDSHV